VEPCCFFESIDRPDESFTVKEIHIRSIPPTVVRFDKCARSRDKNVNMRWKFFLDSNLSGVGYFFILFERQEKPTGKTYRKDHFQRLSKTH